MPGWWAGRSVLVTGATGFLGARLCRRLAALDAHVTGLARSARDVDGVRVRAGDVGSLDAVRAAVGDAEVVFHLAGESQAGRSVERPLATLEANVRGTWNVLEAARTARRPPRVVTASSAAVYGLPTGMTWTEDTPLDVRSAYAASKACAELVSRTYHASYGLDAGVARTTNLYGPGDAAESRRIVPETIEAVLAGRLPVIRGTGRAVRDYLYVDDAVDGYLALAERLDRPGVAGEPFNFAGTQAAPVLEIVETILRLMRRPDLTPRVLGETVDDAPPVRLSTARARERLGWSPRVVLEAGLAQTIAWHASRVDPARAGGRDA
jgi:CDP-glucose 4,6-dehydratase